VARTWCAGFDERSIVLDAGAQIGDDGQVDLPLADDETFCRAAGLVEALATQHGLSEV
jgi:hypothetical protein